MGIVRKKIPRDSLYFTEDIDKQFLFSDASGDKPAQLSIEPLYSGKAVNHWYFKKVAIDLKSIQFVGSKFPVLRDHDTSRIIGFSGKPTIVDDGGRLSLHLPTVTTVGTQFANEVLTIGKEGFPFQASISVRPQKIQELQEGETEEVNGYPVKGPAAIFRNNIYNEGSVCVFGVDRNTTTRVFSEGEIAQLPQIDFEYEDEGPEHQPQPEEVPMTFDPTKFKDDTEFAAFIEKIAADAVAPMQVQLSEATETIKAKNVQIAELSDSSNASNDRLKSLEKAVAKFSEQALAAQANAVVTKLMEGANFSDRQAVKVRPTLPGYDKFVKDDVLDTAAFSDAVSKEIGEWKETFGTTISDSRVQGSGSMPSSFGGGEGSTVGAFSTESILKRMSGYMGMVDAKDIADV